MSTRAQLPFAFARDHQVVLSEGALVAGPEATPTGLREALRRAFDAPVDFTQLDADAFQDRLMAAYQGHGQDGPEEVEAQDSVVLDDSSLEAPPTDLLDTGSDAPVIRLVNHFLRRAVEAQASDLHVEPHEGGLRARIRVDGTLQTIYDRAGAPARRVISRLKVMAGLDIAETRLPQDGHIALRYGGRSIDVRVSTLPGNYGERVVMRVLDKTAGLMPLADLGLRPAQVAELEALSAAPHGIVLAAGPTGAGKTTTLYSLLKLANQAERNILTVEDPIEYDLPGVSQSQINAEIGMTFAAGLRATLRQDPDVILVGEIRDGETAGVAAQAALTGHLVFSSLHANGSVGAVVRLRDLGLDNFLIAATLRGVIAQRLLRRLCPDCREAHPPTAAEAAFFDKHGLALPLSIYAPVGCEACNRSGYAGRVGIFEMLEVTEDLRAAIDRGVSETELRHMALDARETLVGQGLGEVAAGRTSLAETLRVVGDVA